MEDNLLCLHDGTRLQKVFPALSARFVRLNILEAKDGPTIDEFEILK